MDKMKTFLDINNYGKNIQISNFLMSGDEDSAKRILKTLPNEHLLEIRNNCKKILSEPDTTKRFIFLQTVCLQKKVKLIKDILNNRYTKAKPTYYLVTQ